MLILALLQITVHGQDTRDTAISDRIECLLNKFHSSKLDSAEKKEITDLTYRIQNMGFDLGEGYMHRDYSGSLAQIDKALAIWVALGDKANEANNRKFRGYMLGHLKRFPEAKKEIFRAIDLFRAENREFGVAVSELDLSKVYEMESRFDSSFYFTNKALNYWNPTNNAYRIVGLLEQQMNLYCKTRSFDKAEMIQKHTIPFFAKEDLPWQLLIDFYFLSARIYENLGNEASAKKNMELYQEKIKSLEKDNLIARSLFMKRSIIVL